MKNLTTEFVMLLNGIAELTHFKPSDFIVEFYKKSLEPHGLRNVNDALRTMMKGVKRWPTVEDIEATMGILPFEPISIEDMAREAVARIWEAIGTYGYMQPHAAKAFIGELGWKVVERFGGWDRITNVEEDNRGTFTAQWRDLAISLARFHQSGEFSGPALPEAHPLTRAMELIGNVSVTRKEPR